MALKVLYLSATLSELRLAKKTLPKSNLVVVTVFVKIAKAKFIFWEDTDHHSFWEETLATR